MRTALNWSKNRKNNNTNKNQCIPSKLIESTTPTKAQKFLRY